MTTIIRDGVTNVRTTDSLATDILKKRKKMTPIQAQASGKHGKADLHMHSTYSDGSATIEQILEHVQDNTDLDVIALTDHDVIEGSLRARDLWQKKGDYRFDFVVGEEVSTKEGHLLTLLQYIGTQRVRYAYIGHTISNDRCHIAPSQPLRMI